MVRIKRAYEPAEKGDGHRVLVDGLWPRGVKKDRAALDLWARDLAPSAPLRTWFGHEPARFGELARRYRSELRRGPARELLRRLATLAATRTVTLVYGARDEAQRAPAARRAPATPHAVPRSAPGH